MTLFDVLDSTWPAARTEKIGPFTLRITKGAGSRVSAVSCEGCWTDQDIMDVEALAQEHDQSPLFQIRGDHQKDLDKALGSRGYSIRDPSVIYAASAHAICKANKTSNHVYRVWPPLKIVEKIWRQGGIGPERLDVMARVTGPKTVLLVWVNDTPAGVGFVALHEKIAMLHAVEVLKPMRRKGVGTRLLQEASSWAAETGATDIILATTRNNLPANKAYSSQKMEVVSKYHYRKRNTF